jgi:pimeloyl-ACP methyl ester carboxylesterase
MEPGYQEVTLDAGRGPVAARLYGPPGCAAAVLMVSGVGGGFGSPARGLYPALAGDLAGRGICGLRVRYRNPVDLDESVADVAAGVDELVRRGVSRVALVGHSFGGAVVIAAGVAASAVVAVVALATQSYGAAGAGRLSPRPLLLVHGTEDRVLPATCSVHVYDLAGEPKELRLEKGAGHALDEVAGSLRPWLLDWLTQRLSAEPGGP